MKKLLLIFLLIPTISFSQETINNFIISDGLVWQKVFETNLSYDELTNKIKELGILNNIEIADNKMIGQTKLIDADIQGAGFKRMSVPLYILRSLYECFALIEFKEGRYRVTLKNIILVQKYDDPMDKEGSRSFIEDYVIKNDVFANNFIKPSEILDYTFTKSFTILPVEINDDW